jgi:hypothetical protein
MAGHRNLSWEHRRQLLSRLSRPDIANLPKLVAADLGDPHPTSFGAYPIHRQMSRAQLDELAQAPSRCPEYRGLRGNVRDQAPARRGRGLEARPGPHTGVSGDGSSRSPTDSIPVHNPLKAHILFHRLALDRAEGVYDRARFLTYLKLPRFQPYMAATWSDRDEARRFPANLEVDLSPMTLLPKVGPDEPLVRSYLEHFFVDAADTREFDPYINDVYLRHLFAEVKLVNGIGDPEAWASKLPPELLKSLKDRTDIDFAYTNKTEFASVSQSRSICLSRMRRACW